MNFQVSNKIKVMKIKIKIKIYSKPAVGLYFLSVP